MGRGQKSCPKCETFCGPRTRVCSKCGYVYPMKSGKGKTTKVEAPRMEPPVVRAAKPKTPAPALPPMPTLGVAKSKPEVEEEATTLPLPPLALTENYKTVTTFRIKDLPRARQFMADLTATYEAARHGGCYSAFVGSGDSRLQVEMEFGIEECLNKGKK